MIYLKFRVQNLHLRRSMLFHFKEMTHLQFSVPLNMLYILVYGSKRNIVIN